MSEQIKELIEKQIEEAAEYLHNADDRPVATWRDLDSRVVDLMLGFNALLQIVQNLQNEIEELKGRVRDLEPQTALGLLGEVAKKMHAPVAMGENLSDEEYERRKKR
jgi:hypothetical protein